MKYIVIYRYLCKNDFFVDNTHIFDDYYRLQIFLKNLFTKHPDAYVRIFKGFERKLSDFYEFETKA